MTPLHSSSQNHPQTLRQMLFKPGTQLRHASFHTSSIVSLSRVDNNAQVKEIVARMAAKVDRQNSSDKLFTPMVGNF